MKLRIFVLVAAAACWFLRRKKAMVNGAALPKWTKHFVVYRAARHFQMTVPGQMPNEISGILRDDPRTAMQLLSKSRAYAAQRFGEASSAVDIAAIRGLTRTYLKGELDVLNSTNATRHVIRRSHLKDNGSEISEPELQHQCDWIRTCIASYDAAARKLRVMLLRDWIEEHFEQTHGMPIRQLRGDMFAVGR